jgi:regulator of sirC expression with transglutaminase-like and TPR domain
MAGRYQSAWPAGRRRRQTGVVSSLAERLDSLAAHQPDRLDLITAAIARLAPDPPAEDDVAASLDRLAAPLGTGPLSADDVVDHDFTKLGFRGDTAHYHRSANSYIHQVLVRRRGIPITLAVVAAEVGRRVGVPLTVVGLPGHVVVGDGRTSGRWFDPFASGNRLDLDGCRALFGRVQPIDRFDPSMTRSLPVTGLITRMLNNLKVSHHRGGDLPELARVLAVTSELPWSPSSERVELAKVLAAAGRDEQAAVVWEQLAELEPSRASSHRAAARRHLARRN